MSELPAQDRAKSAKRRAYLGATLAALNERSDAARPKAPRRMRIYVDPVRGVAALEAALAGVEEGEAITVARDPAGHVLDVAGVPLQASAVYDVTVDPATMVATFVKGASRADRRRAAALARRDSAARATRDASR